MANVDAEQLGDLSDRQEPPTPRCIGLGCRDVARDLIVAWIRPMGADEVAYHQATVVGREDDHPGAALDYYGSRGETPLRWAAPGPPVSDSRAR